MGEARTEEEAARKRTAQRQTQERQQVMAMTRHFYPTALMVMSPWDFAYMVLEALMVVSQWHSAIFSLEALMVMSQWHFAWEAELREAELRLALVTVHRRLDRGTKTGLRLKSQYRACFLLHTTLNHSTLLDAMYAHGAFGDWDKGNIFDALCVEIVRPP